MSLGPLSGDETHFTWMFVLSKDDVYDSGDAVFEAAMISAEQMAELQVISNNFTENSMCI